MKPAGASVPCCTGCGRSRHLRPPCMRSAPGVALAMRSRSWARTSPVCWSATDGRPIAASPARCTRAAWHICSAGVARSVPTIRGARGQPAGRPSSPTPSRSAIGGMPTRSPSRASLGPAGACLPAWAGSSTRRPLCRRPNASPGISTASSRLCSPSCGPPTSTRPTGALNTPSAPPSSIARSVAGIGRPAAHGPNRSSRVWSAPRVNAMSTSTTSSPSLLRAPRSMVPAAFRLPTL